VECAENEKLQKILAEEVSLPGRGLLSVRKVVGSVQQQERQEQGSRQDAGPERQGQGPEHAGNVEGREKEQEVPQGGGDQEELLRDGETGGFHSLVFVERKKAGWNCFTEESHASLQGLPADHGSSR